MANDLILLGEMEDSHCLERSNRVYSTDGLSPTITTGGGDKVPNFVDEKDNRYYIRRLTPRECGRLMGVSDEDIDKMAEVNSDTQLYKQFGNSIVVDVMCAMFKNLNIEQ